MQIILPVAGKGTRLRPHTFSKPKSLVKVAGKEVMAHILERLSIFKDAKYFFITDENNDDIKNYVKNQFGIDAEYIVQEEKLGPAHAVYLAKDKLDMNDDIMIVFNDSIIDTDYNITQMTDADGIIWVDEVEDPSRFGVVILEEGLITETVEKPSEFVSNLAMVGLYYFKNSGILFDNLDEMIDKGMTAKGEYYLPKAFELMIGKNLKLEAAVVEKWLDCGKPETLLETNRVIMKNNVPDDCTIENSVLIEPLNIGSGTIIKNSIVGPYLSLGKDSVVENSILKHSIIDDNTSIKNIKLKDSIVGKNVELKGTFDKINVGDSSAIRFCNS